MQHLHKVGELKKKPQYFSGFGHMFKQSLLIFVI